MDYDATLKVKKRNNQIVPFCKKNIVVAIRKAMTFGSGMIDFDLSDKIADEIEQELKSRVSITKRTDFYTQTTGNVTSVEEIESMVYNKLIDHGATLTAKKYEGFRAVQEFRRNTHNTIDESVNDLLRLANIEVQEANSNKNSHQLSTQRDLIAGEVSKDICERMILPSHIVQAHKDGVIHYHDLDYAMQKGMFNCCLIDAESVLDRGTVMNGVRIDPPSSFHTACNIITQVMACIASNQYGGQSLDIKHLAKYLRKTRNKLYEELKYEINDKTELDKTVELLYKKELNEGIQTIQYQINTLTTTNGQAPFVTIFMNMEEGYEYEKELADIIEEILKQRIKGVRNPDGAWVTPTFPKLVYVLNKSNNLTGGKYDYLTELAAECTVKRMYPDYISEKIMKQHYDGNVFSPMGCRSFLSPWYDENGKVKFEGRFNQGVVSINLPQIGILSGHNEEKFFELLKARLQICFEALMFRHNQLLGTTSDVSPIHWQYGVIARLEPGETIDKYLMGGYSTISLGYIGVYEATILVKGCSHTEPEGTRFALRLMQYLKDTVAKWKEETNIGFALYGTPAESLCYRFCKIDKELYGDIPNVTDKGYYTNSYHVDVREHIDAFEKFKFEEQFQKLSTGGCISYAEFPSLMKNVESVKQIIKFIYNNIQYAEFNTKSDYCCECGYNGEMFISDDGKFECPVCHNNDRQKMYVTRRTCGYLGSNDWNKGKMAEFKQRYVHIGEEELK